MRVFPRLTLPSPKTVRRLRRRVRGHLSVKRVYYLIEALLVLVLFLLLFSGSRLRLIDSFGGRSDMVTSLLLVGLIIPLHFLARRRLLPNIERHYNPVPYDEHKIFFDLGQGTRTVTSIDQLYENLATRIREAFEASSASIFVRDEASGDYHLRVLSGLPQPGTRNNRAQGSAEKTHTLGGRAFVVRRLLNLSTPLTIEPGELETWSQAIHSTLPSHREERASEHEILRAVKARLLVQIRQKDELVGILALGPRRAEFNYSASDRELLMSLAAQLALVIDNARLTERMVVQERLRRELALAAEVQQRLLPSGPPEGVAMDVAGFCEPARGVGGDYYDFINFDNRQVGLAIADVAGKGMPAALLMSTVQATLRSLTARNGSPVPVTPELAKLVGKLNRLLFDSTNGEHYVTFFYATFDQSTQLLTYVNAGHNPPLYLRADEAGDFRQLTAGGLVAGAFGDSAYEQETVQMKSKDLLFLYTDGLTEAQNLTGEEFGTARIMEALKSYASLPVAQIRDEVVKRVKEWCFGMPLYDDLTFVVMKVK